MVKEKHSAPTDNDNLPASKPPGPNRIGPGDYVVVARRYRPQSFDELVGQQQVGQALSNAISQQRVGHAYLFTGARGVGKTSAARIFAKSLVCEKGPTATPCNQCDICESVAVGEDVDVLEIDGASNRGIDEIRQLRSNVHVRPSRARCKIYIIDEVHMLTPQAFNALLKTLEEPPEHVKFIFCTTDPEKIPITVLSRCQRFDFPPVASESIVERLRQIVKSEGVSAEDEALRILARRAEGSVRDSQSLLEQILSFCGDEITVEQVHQMLGTANSGRLFQLIEFLIARDAKGALQALEDAVREGVDVGQIAEQLFGCMRDMMAHLVGCDAELLRHVSADPKDVWAEALHQAADQWGLETLMASVQILDRLLTSLRYSTQRRTLLEVALIRMCKLEDLQQLAEMMASVGAQTTTSPTKKKIPDQKQGFAAPKTQVTVIETNSVPKPASAPPKEGVSNLNADVVEGVWRQALANLEDMTADVASYCDRVAIFAPNRLVVYFSSEYNAQKELCERPDRKSRLEQSVSQIVGQPMVLQFETEDGGADKADVPQPPPPASRRQRQREIERLPVVREATELFDGEVTHIEEPRRKPDRD